LIDARLTATVLVHQEDAMLSIVTDADAPSIEALTVQQCAHIVGRSTSWVRDRIQSGALQADRHVGRYMVRPASLNELMSYLRTQQHLAPKRSARPRHLRLVVDNSGTMK
jgi:hypothetical protein